MQFFETFNGKNVEGYTQDTENIPDFLMDDRIIFNIYENQEMIE